VPWGQAVLPAGEYVRRVVDVGRCVFVVIRDTKKGKNVAHLPPVMNSEAKDLNALLIANEGDQRIVPSLRLRDLGEVLIYEPRSCLVAETSGKHHRHFAAGGATPKQSRKPVYL
jgi:hypothetical protein